MAKFWWKNHERFISLVHILSLCMTREKMKRSRLTEVSTGTNPLLGIQGGQIQATLFGQLCGDHIETRVENTLVVWHSGGVEGPNS
ncbi:hypothetical protein EV401DRAFT_2022798 [Pisolithus croceorrhizus]|nr:hypothetical protein EV401DRAFT_2022798 [Pisolithus croceorrhizus]